MIVSINIVLKKYSAVLNGSLSCSDADRWAWEAIQAFDNGKLEFELKEKEQLVWRLIQYLYGIDIPDTKDKSKFLRNNSDIISFLKKEGVYNELEMQ